MLERLSILELLQLEAQAVVLNPHALDSGVDFAVARDAHHLAAAWPITLTRFSAFNLVRTPVSHTQGIAGAPMLADTADTDAVAALLQSLPADTILAKAVATDTDFWRLLTQLQTEGKLGLTIFKRWERSILRRDAATDAEAYLADAMSASSRKRYRNKQRGLADLGPLRLAIAEDAVDLTVHFRHFSDLEALSWKGENGTALQQHPVEAAYVRETLLAMAAQNRAFTAVLFAGERPLAAGLFLRTGGEAFFWKTAYDPALSKQSPGVILDMMVTDWLYRQPWFELLDSSTDDSIDPATLIWKQRREMADVLIQRKPRSISAVALRMLLRGRYVLRDLKNRRA